MTDPWSVRAERPRALIRAVEIEHTQVVTARALIRARMEDKSKKALDAHIAERHADGWLMQHYSTSAATYGGPPEVYHDFIWRRS